MSHVAVVLSVCLVRVTKCMYARMHFDLHICVDVTYKVTVISLCNSIV